MRSLFLIFLIVPLVEIYFLIKIGSIVGAGWTIFLVVFTAMLGAFLVRTQGFSTLARAQMQLARAEVPAMEMIEGFCLFLAGALLLTPGFFTDTVGFILLTPPLRRSAIRYFMTNRAPGHGQPGFRTTDQTASARSPTSQHNRIIDGEYKNLD